MHLDAKIGWNVSLHLVSPTCASPAQRHPDFLSATIDASETAALSIQRARSGNNLSASLGMRHESAAWSRMIVRRIEALESKLANR
jgi:hypothetical protein